MSNYNTTLQSNNTDLQAILNTINELPETGGIELPSIANEGLPDDLVSGKELINSSGNIVIGTNPYEKVATDTEVNTQADLITQIMTALESKTGFNTIYIGSSIPTDDFGINGDIYVVRGNA
jgi:hypothetical protein